MSFWRQELEKHASSGVTPDLAVFPYLMNLVIKQLIYFDILHKITGCITENESFFDAGVKTIKNQCSCYN